MPGDGSAAGAFAVIEGRALHSGRDVSLRIVARPGPLVFRTERGDARLDELEIVRADHGVRVRCARIGLDVDVVEHLLAALGGLGIRQGVALEIDGGEVPLSDGGALAFARALLSLGVEPSAPPSVVVARDDEIVVGASRYAFARADRVWMRAGVSFDAEEIGAQQATWDGTPGGFVREVAWARTFGFRRDAEALLAAGRARGVDHAKVMVLDARGRVEPPGAPAGPAEMARHKLLDLIGDATLLGGPVLGAVEATRPGHAATHRAFREAFGRGVLRDRGMAVGR